MLTYLQDEISSDHRDRDRYLYTHYVQKITMNLYLERLSSSSPSSSSSVICQTTGPKSLPKRFLHIVRSRASSFNLQYPLLSLRSDRSRKKLQEEEEEGVRSYWNVYHTALMPHIAILCFSVLCLLEFSYFNHSNEGDVRLPLI